MEKFVINEIYTDGYERYAVVQVNEQERKICVHFFEYDECLENNKETRKRRIGDLLEGELSISLVCASKKVYEEFDYYQKIPKSSHIEAVVEVVNVVDDYSLKARSSILPENIMIEFETSVDYKVGDRIWVSGSLELDIGVE